MVRSEIKAASIAGGFVRVLVAELAAAWDACRQRPLGTADFRTWLAAREMTARRLRVADHRVPTYTFDELARLCQVTRRRARASIRRLITAGLIQWADSAISFPPLPLPAGPWAESIGRARGAVAIPRRILRFLAAGASPATIAVALAALLRCVSRRRSGWDGRGRFKASWVAMTFAVSLRQARSARKALVALGWLVPEPSAQWAENRWGRAYRMDLAWQSPRPASPTGPRSAPPTDPAGPRSAPPVSDPDPLAGAGRENQYPAPGGPAGAQVSGTGNPADPLTPPRLANVLVEDLKDTGRLLELHRQAIERRLVTASEADRLRVMAAAEHAQAVGRTNPAGLFAQVIRRGLWKYLTHADEDRAGARLKAWLRGPCPTPPAAPAAPAGRPSLSEDARTAREVRRSLAASGYRGDPFPALRRHDPGWTRERWDRALAELVGRDGAG